MYSYYNYLLIFLLVFICLYLFRKFNMVRNYYDNLIILYEDEYIIVIDKPANIASHNSTGWYGPSIVELLNATGYKLYKNENPDQDGIVHRLDVGTSGVMVLAKNEFAYKNLKDQFRYRTVTKIYHALVEGNISETTGAIYDPIGQVDDEEYAFDVMPEGKPSTTNYKKLLVFPELNLFPTVSLLEINIETGRTHQIRLHFSNKNHPLVGDFKYGSDRGIAARLELKHQWLHAKQLEVNHPLTGKRMIFTSEYPYDLQNSIDLLTDNTNNRH